MNYPKNRKRRPLEARFWEKVDKSRDCWEWQGARTAAGYGKFGVEHRTMSAHRLAWELGNGPIPDGMHVCHHCDNPPCVRPDHLFLGTPTENMQDCVTKGRWTKPQPASVHWTKLHPERLARGDRSGARTHPERVRRGERVSLAKLTASDVIEIRRRYAAGERQVELALVFGIRQTNVSNIVRRLTWRHIP